VFLDKADSSIQVSSVITTVTGKNQVTLPAELVRELGWRPGTRIDWKKAGDNALLAKSLPSRGEIAMGVMGVARSKSGTDPIAELQRVQEEEDSTF
jgi:bifunctional DNA-binding transcriptional regulator/antitoxin component of YhaV-PrlF toxin-antitoxin module